MVRIYTLALPFPSAEVCGQKVSPERLAAWRARHGAVREGARESLAALLLLDRVLPAGDLIYSSTGKPLLRGGEASFSLSHTKGRVFCAALDAKGGEPLTVGIDAELLAGRAPSRCASLSRRWFTQREQERLSAAGNTEQEFLRIWTAKEALVKATGEGLAGLAAADTARVEERELQILTINAEELFLSVVAPRSVRIDPEILETSI